MTNWNELRECGINWFSPAYTVDTKRNTARGVFYGPYPGRMGQLVRRRREWL